MVICKHSNANTKSNEQGLTGQIRKLIPGSCFALIIASVTLGSIDVMADNSAKKDEHIGGYTLTDGSMLGRYGDMNDEWHPAVVSTSVEVSMQEMTPEKTSKTTKKVGRIGAFSMEDNARLGAYGDRNDE